MHVQYALNIKKYLTPLKWFAMLFITINIVTYMYTVRR
jgi:hypothetical protein